MTFLVSPSGARSAAGASLCVFAGVCAAQSTTLEPVVVTATRTPQPASAAISDITVIDRDRLELLGSRTLDEVLARVAGVQRTSNGGPGNVSSVFIRGAESRHTLLLIDGVPYGSATSGTPAWSAIPVEQIERIEVLKGPAAALYGSSAVGGVVQIFTRGGSKETRFNAALRAGSDSTVEASAGVNGSSGAVGYALQLQGFRSEGFSSTNPHAQFNNYNPDTDPYRQTSISGRVGTQFNADWKADVSLLANSGRVHYDDGAGRDTQSDLRSNQLAATLNGKLGAGWNTTLRVAQNVDDSEGLVGAFLPSRFKTTGRLFQWQTDVATPVGTLLAGLESLRQSVDSSTAYDVTQRTINSALLGLTGQSGRHHWQLNARHDRNSQFGSADTGSAGYGFDLTSAWRISALHGTSFTAPSFNQLYFPKFGSPALQPERGRSTEVALRWQGNGQNVRLTAFDNRIRGFINSAKPTDPIAQASIEGQSIAWDGQFGDVNANLGIDLMRPRNQLNGKSLPRRADQQANAGAGYRYGAFDVGGSLLAVGERFDDAANTPARRLAGYVSADAYANYRFSPTVTFELRLNNLGGQVYETAYGYNQAGRQVFVGARFAGGL